MSTVVKPITASAPDVRREAFPLAPVLWFGGLLIFCYLPILIPLVKQWLTDEDMGHGIFVPVVAGYIAWSRRSLLPSVPARGNYLGLALVAFGAMQSYLGELGAEFFLSRTGFIEALAGVVLFLCGFPGLRLFAFPIGLLFFMVPIPAVIYNQITMPLQYFASEVAANTLDLIGIPVLQNGNVLELPSQQLQVVEACSGIRSLLTLTFLSLVYAWFFDAKVWMRAVLFFATIPIAIVANAARVTITGVLSEVNPELAHGFLHTAEGWVIFMVALGMLMITHYCINVAWRLWRKRAA